MDEFDIEIDEEEYMQTEQKMQMQKKVKSVVNSNKGEMRTALVMLLSLMTGAEGRGEEVGDAWLDYAVMSMLILNVVGALSVAMGMWKFLQWCAKEKDHEGRDKESKNCQTEEEDDPHIVFKLYERIDELHSEIDYRDEQIQALTQALEACESQLKTQCQQSVVLSSAVREHEQRWIRSQNATITIHPCGDVYHTSSSRKWFQGGRSLTLCAQCKRHCAQEGSVPGLVQYTDVQS